RRPSSPPLSPYTTLFRSPSSFLISKRARDAPPSPVRAERGQVPRRGGDGIRRVPHAAQRRDAVGARFEQLSHPLRRDAADRQDRSEEHTSELQSREKLVC